MKAKAANEELSTLCKALAHPVRVQILRMLRERAHIGSDLVEALPVAQSTVSEHLRILKEAGLVYDELQGHCRRYYVNREPLERLKALIAGL